MRTKIFLIIVMLFITVICRSQEIVDVSILTTGIQIRIKEQTDSVKNITSTISQKIVLLKKDLEQQNLLKKLNTEYKSDSNKTILAINELNNSFQITKQNQEKLKGVISNKKIELLGLFTQEEPVPLDQINEIDKEISELSKSVSVVREKMMDKNVVVNEKYSQQQKDSLINLTIKYRELVDLSEQTKEIIQKGNNFGEKLDGYIKNRKEFLVNAEKIKKEYEIEIAKKRQLIAIEDSSRYGKKKLFDSEKEKYFGYKVKFIAIKIKLKPEEKGVFDKIEYELSKNITDSVVVSVTSIDSINSRFKDQYNQLVKLNTELGKKKKENSLLSGKINFIVKFNLELENIFKNIYIQESKALEDAKKRQEELERQLNDAKNGVVDVPQDNKNNQKGTNKETKKKKK